MGVVCVRDNSSMPVWLLCFVVPICNHRTDCLDLPNASPRGSVVLYPCHGGRGNQYWQVLPVRENDTSVLQIRHVTSNYCLESEVETLSVVANLCVPGSRAQQWIWEKLQFKEARESRKLAGV